MQIKLLDHSHEVTNVFSLMGKLENDITKSIAWVMANNTMLVSEILEQIYPKIAKSIQMDHLRIEYQKYSSGKGYTDLELIDLDNNIHIIIEAKRGWLLPLKDQLEQYRDRDDFKNSKAKFKCIVSMSECSHAYASTYLPEIKGVLVKHVSWEDVYYATKKSYLKSNNKQKI